MCAAGWDKQVLPDYGNSFLLRTEQSSPLSTCSFLVLGEVFLYRPYSKLLSKRSGRPYYHGQGTPTSHEEWGGGQACD